MRVNDLRGFLHLLEQASQLARIPVPVDPHLELATIADLVSKGAGRGQALLFEAVRGSTLPVAVNLFGTPERVSWAIGTTDLQGKARQLAADLAACAAVDGTVALAALCGQAEWQPVVTSNPAWGAVDCGRLGLGALPAIRAWPEDGGTFLTLPQVYTRDPDGTQGNCGMYRVQCHDSHAATIRCRPGSGAARHLAAWHARGLAMPVAIALGGPPILNWAAAAPLPDDVDEVAFCGYLQGGRMVMSACALGGLLVPATAEVVIEGVIEPGAVAAEGPFGNHTGRYDAAATAPLLTVHTVHMRERAIYPWTLVGPPPMENIHLAQASACLFEPLVKMALPTVSRIYMPPEGIFHGAALVTVEPDEERPLPEIVGLLRSTPLLAKSRLLIVGCSDHDPHNLSDVFWRVLNRTDWHRDLLVEGRQLTVDARRLPAGRPVACDAAVMARVLERWHEFRLDGAGE